MQGRAYRLGLDNRGKFSFASTTDRYKLHEKHGNIQEIELSRIVRSPPNILNNCRVMQREDLQS